MDYRKLLDDLFAPGRMGGIWGPLGYRKTSAGVIWMHQASKMGFRVFSNIVFQRRDGGRWVNENPPEVTKVNSWALFWYEVGKVLLRDSNQRILFFVDEFASSGVTGKRASALMVVATEAMLPALRKGNTAMVVASPLDRLLPPSIRDKRQSFLSFFFLKDPANIWLSGDAYPGDIKDYGVLDFFGADVPLRPKLLKLLPFDDDRCPWLWSEGRIIGTGDTRTHIFAHKSFASFSIGFHEDGKPFDFQEFNAVIGDVLPSDMGKAILDYFRVRGRPSKSAYRTKRGMPDTPLADRGEDESDEDGADIIMDDNGQSPDDLRTVVLTLRGSNHSIRQIAAQTGLKKWKVEAILREGNR